MGMKSGKLEINAYLRKLEINAYLRRVIIKINEIGWKI